tara:strand:- start:6131 stop:8608 length:2478 start_codon:yes stop_codon:yes gene_type:complete
MGTPLRIKRSAVPGKIPAVQDLQLGELALNTYDAELYTLRYRPGIGTEVVKIGGASVQNILYVNKNGDDSNTGLTLADAKATIKGAVGIASEGTTIKVASGTYIEDNPVKIPPQISIVGGSLREVSIIPQNADQDLFHVSPGVLVSDCSFTGTMDVGKAIVAFDPDNIQYSNQSPYILNCTNFVTNSIGMKIDGSHQIGPFKAMVTDSFTQYNQNGIGVSITNEGYAQIVSMFTINTDAAVFTGSGGQCDLTNSNSSFGNYGLIAEGIGPHQYTGTIASTAAPNADRFEINMTAPDYSIRDAIYDNVTGLTTISTYTNNGFNVGMGVTLNRLGFGCTEGDYAHIFQYGSSSSNSINITGGNQVTPTAAAYNPTSGYLALTIAGHGLSGSTNHTISTATYTPTTGLLSVTINGHGFNNGEYVRFDQESITFTCAKDSHATEHSYPRITDPVYNKWLQISNKTLNTFDVNVGISEDTTEHWFKSASNNGITKANDTLTIDANSLVFTCAKDNHATEHSYPRTTDPSYNQILGVETVSTDVLTINVGVATHEQFPDKYGNVFTIEEIIDDKNFTTYVGPNRFSHDYLGGGKASMNLIRPFDGKVIYFDDLYNTIGRVKITNPGSGYNNPPTITIDPPSTTNTWGVKATATATIIGDHLDEVTIISSGRGYTSLPEIVFSTPDVGINTATATIELLPSYYSVKTSTPISSGICTVTINENVPYAVGVGSTTPFYRQSRILASSHSFEYIGSGVDPIKSLPSRGGVPIQENEVDNRDGGLVIYTSTDQGGNFRIGEGVKIDQISGTITGNFYSKSLFANVTPLILALGGE